MKFKLVLEEIMRLLLGMLLSKARDFFFVVRTKGST